MEDNIIVSIKNFGVTFFDKKTKAPYFILRDINLNLSELQKIAIVGESGSGKTTLGNSILLLNELSETNYTGEIVFYPLKKCKICLSEYHIVSDEMVKKKYINHIRGNHISIVFQDPFVSLNPVIPVGKQIEEVLLNHNRDLTKKELYERTLELISLVNLKEPQIIYKKYPHQLSGGQLQRICIAVAVANNPEVIIADEPTTALDASLKETILNLLVSLVENNNSTLILISHDINLIKNYVDYVYVLYAGEFVENGPTKEIFSNPLHPYTQLLLSCSVDKSKKGKKLPTIPYDFPNLFDKEYVFNKCIFYNRCDKKLNICHEKKPYFYPVNYQKVKCFLYEQ